MTPDQARLVRMSWSTVAPRADVLAARFYTCLFDIDASAATLFDGVDMDAQRVKLTASLAVIVAAVDDPDRLFPALASLGKRHARYGIESRHFEAVGDALLQALADTLGDAWSASLRDAWAEAYSLVAAVMRRALVRAVGASG